MSKYSQTIDNMLKGVYIPAMTAAVFGNQPLVPDTIATTMELLAMKDNAITEPRTPLTENIELSSALESPASCLGGALSFNPSFTGGSDMSTDRDRRTEAVSRIVDEDTRGFIAEEGETRVDAAINAYLSGRTEASRVAREGQMERLSESRSYYTGTGIDPAAQATDQGTWTTTGYAVGAPSPVPTPVWRERAVSMRREEPIARHINMGDPISTSPSYDIEYIRELVSPPSVSSKKKKAKKVIEEPVKKNPYSISEYLASH